MRELITCMGFLFMTVFYSCHTQGLVLSDTGTSRLNETLPPNPLPGACYNKYRPPIKYETSTEEFAEYTGDIDNEDVDVVIRKIEILPAKTRWEQRLHPESSEEAANPNYIMCLVKDSAEYIHLTVLEDTTQSKNYRLRSIEIERVVSSGTEIWRQVLCEKEKTVEICEQITQQLWTRGLLEHQSPCVIRGNTVHLSKEARAAFKAFQVENNLEHAYLDLETLDLLGVFY